MRKYAIYLLALLLFLGLGWAASSYGEDPDLVSSQLSQVQESLDSLEAELEKAPEAAAYIQLPLPLMKQFVKDFQTSINISTLYNLSFETLTEESEEWRKSSQEAQNRLLKELEAERSATRTRTVILSIAVTVLAATTTLMAVTK